MVYRLTLFLVFRLVLCDKNGSAVNATGTRLPLSGTDETSKRTVPRHRAAMDMIMMANNRLKHKHLNEDRTKRRNITGNTTTQDAIIEINEGERIADDLNEGDIILDPMDPEDFQLIKLKKENKDGLVEETMRKRQASRQLKFLWHNRQVPYHIHSSLAKSKNVILEAINKFNQKSCVQFVPYRQGVTNYVTFAKNDGCSSRIGRAYTTTGEQRISIGDFCEYVPIIMHEMLHAVGFYHEQSRPDRDNYVKILWENIGKVYHTQFLKYTHGDIDRFGIGYNYKSIMHYGRTDFSSGNGDSIQAIQKPQLELGGEVMTPEDIMELDTLYDCKTRTYNSWTSWGSYGPCDTQCYKGRQRYCYGRTPSSCGGNPNAYGVETQYIKCATNECPVRINGHWGRWEAWTNCNSKCNEGSITRVRKCDSPKPGNNGLKCPNSEKEYSLCIKPRCTLGKDDTDFRDGQLGSMWRNDVYDTPGFDWLVGKGDTTTEGTGPSKDRYGNTYGYYLYIDSTSRARNDNARLFSHIIPPATGQNKRCLKFYYHMYGATTGSLSIAVYPVGKTPDNIFWKSGNQGNKWHLAQVTLDSSTQFQLVFEARVAGPAYSDIAIDDVFIDKGSCDCQDYYQNCSMWAKDKQCSEAYAFMSKYCKRACNLCGLCKDAMPECGTTWSEEQCRKNPAFMEIVCPSTCHSCYCYDKQINCVEWKKNGKCNENRTYMNYYCPKSCGLCS